MSVETTHPTVPIDDVRSLMFRLRQVSTAVDHMASTIHVLTHEYGRLSADGERSLAGVLIGLSDAESELAHEFPLEVGELTRTLSILADVEETVREASDEVFVDVRP